MTDAIRHLGWVVFPNDPHHLAFRTSARQARAWASGRLDTRAARESGCLEQHSRLCRYNFVCMFGRLEHTFSTIFYFIILFQRAVSPSNQLASPGLMPGKGYAMRCSWVANGHLQLCTQHQIAPKKTQCKAGSPADKIRPHLELEIGPFCVYYTSPRRARTCLELGERRCAGGVPIRPSPS